MKDLMGFRNVVVNDDIGYSYLRIEDATCFSHVGIDSNIRFIDVDKIGGIGLSDVG